MSVRVRGSPASLQLGSATLHGCRLRVVSVSMERKQPGRLLLEEGEAPGSKTDPRVGGAGAGFHFLREAGESALCPREAAWKVWPGLPPAGAGPGGRPGGPAWGGTCPGGGGTRPGGPVGSHRVEGSHLGTGPAGGWGSGAERAAWVWASVHGLASLPSRTHLPCDPTSRAPAPASWLSPGHPCLLSGPLPGAGMVATAKVRG